MKTSQWNNIPGEKTINETANNLKARNIKVEIFDDKQSAIERIKNMIPAGEEVMTGGSTTLDEIGFTELLKSGAHPWKNLKEKIISEKDPEIQQKLRRESTLADYYLGSVHAISKNGEIVVASATGSQLPAYVFSSPHVIWVVGVQKIMPDVEMAIKRVREYVLPLEDARMKKEGYPGSVIGKLVMFEKEFVPDRITLLLVKEKLGF